MKIFITNLGRYNEGYLIGKWVKLPVSEDKLCEVLEAIGINEYYEEYFITDYENEIAGIGDVVSEFSSIQALNELAQRLEDLSEADTEKLEAVLEYEACRSVTDIMDIIDQLDEFDLLSDIDDDEGLGYYYAEVGCINIPESILPYFDFTSYGRDIRLESACLYTSFGCVIDNR